MIRPIITIPYIPNKPIANNLLENGVSMVGRLLWKPMEAINKLTKVGPREEITLSAKENILPIKPGT